MENLQAVIKNGKVENIIVADARPDGIDVTATDPRPGVGWSYDGTTFTAPPAPVYVPQPQITLQRAILLARMTATEIHAWIRAVKRAEATNTPTAADRNALYAWYRWDAMGNDVDLTGDDMQGLKSVWVALGMTQARADEILTPVVA